MTTRQLGLVLGVAAFVAACASEDSGEATTPSVSDTGTTQDAAADTASPPDSTDEDTGDGGADGSPQTDAGEVPDLGPDPTATYTWYRDIAPLLETHCGSCHLPGGQGTGDFTNPLIVQSFAPAILAAVSAGRMPPPASDPECQDYIGADRWVVPDDFGARIQTWIDEGHPRGAEDDYTPVPPIAARLDDANLEVRLPQAYTPTFQDADNPGNEYRCFVVEHGRDETFYIQKMAPIIDRPELVHHIVLFKARRADVPAVNDPMTGYDCIDMTFFVGSGGAADLLTGDSGMISAWAPGSQAVDFGPDYGIKMEPDHVLIMQMHYFNGAPGSVQPDLSGYEFTVDDTPRKAVLMMPFGPNGFRIPAGDAAYERSAEVNMPIALRLHGVMPHMHYLGQSYRMWYRFGSTETCVVESENYDFNNQLTYMFPEPLTIRAGSQVGFSCVWDNSTGNPNLIFDPPQEIRYGERTDEEMCYGFALVSVGR